MPARTPAKPRSAAKRWCCADHDQRRELIVQTALKLLHDKGLSAVTMRAVASKLGVGAMTLYTYIKDQHGLHREMVKTGFQMLSSGCDQASTLGTTDGWRGGAAAYLSFAAKNPNLYKLMFDTPMAPGDQDVLRNGIQPLFNKVRGRLEAQGLKGRELDRQISARAGRFWIALHGLASLTTAGRLAVLDADPDELLDNLLAHVAPDLA